MYKSTQITVREIFTDCCQGLGVHNFALNVIYCHKMIKTCKHSSQEIYKRCVLFLYFMWAGCTYFILLWLRITCSVKLCKLWQYLFLTVKSPCWWLHRSRHIEDLLNGTRKILKVGDGFCLCTSVTAEGHVNALKQIKSTTIGFYTIAFKISRLLTYSRI